MNRHIYLVVAFAPALAVWACASSLPPEAAAPPSLPEAPPAEVVAPPPPQASEPEKSAAPSVPAATTLEGFMTPESVLHDVDGDVYLVSNINGSPLEADDNGFISKVAPDGKLTELKWIDGLKPDVKLNAPKGMAISGDKLYVADITFVRVFDRKSGAPAGDIEIKGSTFLNAVATAPDGSVYVSDSGLKAGKEGFEPTGTDAIYRIDPAKKNKLAPLIKSKDLGRPNGLLADAAGVWVVTFGSGELYRVTPQGKKETAVKLPKGQLDGLAKLEDGRLLVSSWEAQAVFRGTPAGPFEARISGVKSPAGIGYDAKRRRVLIPLFLANAVQLAPLD